MWGSYGARTSAVVVRSYFKNKLRASLPKAIEKGWQGDDDLLHDVIVTKPDGSVFISTWKELSWRRWENDENIDRIV